MKNMRYHLAHSRDIKKNGWNNRCPSCGQRKFSPYIDFHTGKPINENDDDNDNENRYPFRNNVIAFRSLAEEKSNDTRRFRQLAILLLNKIPN